MNNFQLRVAFHSFYISFKASANKKISNFILIKIINFDMCFKIFILLSKIYDKFDFIIMRE